MGQADTDQVSTDVQKAAAFKNIFIAWYENMFLASMDSFSTKGTMFWIINLDELGVWHKQMNAQVFAIDSTYDVAKLKIGQKGLLSWWCSLVHLILIYL